MTDHDSDSIGQWSLLGRCAYDVAVVFGWLGYLPVWCVRGRAHREWWKRWGWVPQALRTPPQGPRVWLHTVSVGEAICAVPLATALTERTPNIELGWSTITATGQQVARQQSRHPERVFYCPLDVSVLVARAISVVQPQLFVAAETELWPNLIGMLGRQNIPVVIVNGRLSDRSFTRYQRWQRLLEPCLRHITAVAAQTDRDRERFVALGVPPERVRTTGHLKFDTESSLAEEGCERWRRRMGLTSTDLCWVVGSTHPGEEPLIAEAFQRLRRRWPALRLLIAPRHPTRASELVSLFRAADTQVRCLSEFHAASDGQPLSWNVTVVDTVGDLAMLYGLGSVVFVGGSLVPIGGHNPIEPARWGVPMVTGLHVDNFLDIVELFWTAGGLHQVATVDELVTRIEQYLDDPAACARDGAAARDVVTAHQGATQRTLEFLEPWLP